MNDRIKNIIMLGSLIISMMCIFGAGTCCMIAFLWARYDHDMKLIALTGVISIASQMMATASTLLVGRAFGNNNDKPPSLPDPLPANSTLTSTSTSSLTTPPAPTVFTSPVV